MSIAATATSLDAFPTAPARTLMVRVRLVHAAFSSGPTPPAMTAPRPLSRPPQLLQISIVGAPGEPGARRAGKPAGTTVGYTPFRSRSCSATPGPLADRSADECRGDAKLRDGSDIDRLVLEGLPGGTPMDVSNRLPTGKQTHDAMRPELTISNSSDRLHAASAAFFRSEEPTSAIQSIIRIP